MHVHVYQLRYVIPEPLVQFNSYTEHTERTWVARFVLILLNRLVPKVTDNDEQSNKYSHSNYPQGWPQRSQTICTNIHVYRVENKYHENLMKKILFVDNCSLRGFRGWGAEGFPTNEVDFLSREFLKCT